MATPPHRLAAQLWAQQIAIAEHQIDRLKALADAFAQLGLHEDAREARELIAQLQELVGTMEAERRAALGVKPIGH
jgi:hypothetical protein